MSTYDLSSFNGTTTTNVFEATAVVNTASGGLLGLFILLLVFFAVLFGTRGGLGDMDAWIIASFITGIVGFLLFLASLLTWYFAILPISVLIITLLIKFLK
jgi:hypothetical protein